LEKQRADLQTSVFEKKKVMEEKAGKIDSIVDDCNMMRLKINGLDERN
jgi:hypothetical protein